MTITCLQYFGSHQALTFRCTFTKTFVNKKNNSRFYVTDVSYTLTKH